MSSAPEVGDEASEQVGGVDALGGQTRRPEADGGVTGGDRGRAAAGHQEGSFGGLDVRELRVDSHGRHRPRDAGQVSRSGAVGSPRQGDAGQLEGRRQVTGGAVVLDPHLG